jgi:hypothetical protein
MFKVKTFRKCYNYEELLDEQVATYLNSNHIRREDIVDIKYYTENEWLYCTIIWEDK